MTTPSDSLTATTSTKDRHIFLSYSSQDRDLALELKHALEAHGINVWIDLDRIRSGSLIVTELVARLLILDRFQNRIQSFELHAGASRGELPVHLHLHSISGTLPGRHFVCQRGQVRNAAVETLSPQHPQCNFRHIEPTAMLGGVVHLQLGDQSAGFLRWKRCIQ